MLNKNVLISVLMIVGTLNVAAQSSTNSPYTRYGLGDLQNKGFVNNAAMGGIGYALRNSYHINMTNPAAFSSVDSLSFMFDIGMSLKNSNFTENNIHNNAKNSSFDYIAMQFRLHPRIGIAVGFTPFSNVGYNFNITTPVEGDSETTATNLFYGDGGLQQITAGLGFKILDNLSIGFNAGYLFGTLDYQTGVTFSTTSDPTYIYNRLKVKSYTADLGIQYTHSINEDDQIAIGAVYNIGHTLNSTYNKGVQITNTQVYETSQNAFSIPNSFGIGVAYNKKKNLTIGLDYTLQKWSKAKYENQYNAYKDRSKIAVGAEYLPDIYGRSYLQRIRYRIGAHYSNAYLKLPQYNGPSEYGISAGFGFPVFSSNSIINLTGEYVRVQPSVSHALSENRFVIKLGLTLNETWFVKWKVN